MGFEFGVSGKIIKLRHTECTARLPRLKEIIRRKIVKISNYRLVFSIKSDNIRLQNDILLFYRRISIDVRHGYLLVYAVTRRIKPCL